MVSAPPRPELFPRPPAPRPTLRSGPPTAPFPRVADPRAYVARPACEEALAALARALDEGARAALLEGPARIGKSLLLRVLETRLGAGFEVVRLPLAGTSFDELGAIALAGLSERSVARSALTLEDAARRLRVAGRALVVAVDDAARLSTEAAEGLARSIRAGRGALRVVLAVETGAARPRLPGGARTVRLAAAMSPEETAHYVATRLARAADPRLARAFGPAVVAELHARSGGVPGALHALAEGVLDEARSVGLLDGEHGAVGTPVLGPPVGGYLPRAEMEGLLASLASELRSGRRTQLVRGGAGLGKTTVLRELGARLREPFQPVDVYYAKLEPADFFAWVLHQIGAPTPERAPELELREIAARLARVGGTLVLLIDEAQSLPADTAARLAESVAAAHGALRVVAAIDLDADPQPLRVLPDLLEHRLVRPLDLAECGTYVDWRLDAAPQGLRAHFGPEVVRDLHNSSGGNPRALARLTGELERAAVAAHAARRGPPSPAAVAPAPGGATPGLAPARERAPAAGAPRPLNGARSARAAARARGGGVAAPAPIASPPAARTTSARRRPALPPAHLALVAPLALGAGIPLALFALWLWLAPLFSAPRAPATLSISAPPGTALAVDGRYLGEAPLAGVELPPGVYALRAVLPDGALVERRIVLWPRGASLRVP